MAVQAQFGGLAGCLPLYGGAGGFAEEQVQALLSAAAAGNKGYQYNCAAGVVSGAQSELTCNGGALPSRKRGREDEFEQYVSSSSAALLPIPAMMHKVVVAPNYSPPAIANRMVDSAAVSTSGRPSTASSSSEWSAADALVAELCRQGAEVDALVRGECERLRAGLEQAHKRQRQALARAAAAGAARLVRAKDAELGAARRRAAELEERLRQAAAEAQAWRGAARSSEAVAAGLRAALDALLLRGAGAPVQPADVVEGSGESDPAAAADDAQSCFFVEAEDAGGGAGAGVPSQPAEEGFGESDAASCCIAEAECAGACAAATSSPLAPAAGKGRACGGGEASVLVLPCRHLCLCKACEPRWDACPVCLAAKTASIHVAAD